MRVAYYERLGAAREVLQLADIEQPPVGRVPIFPVRYPAEPDVK
jgi:hypothetical protein